MKIPIETDKYLYDSPSTFRTWNKVLNKAPFRSEMDAKLLCYILWRKDLGQLFYVEQKSIKNLRFIPNNNFNASEAYRLASIYCDNSKVVRKFFEKYVKGL